MLWYLPSKYCSGIYPKSCGDNISVSSTQSSVATKCHSSQWVEFCISIHSSLGTKATHPRGRATMMWRHSPVWELAIYEASPPAFQPWLGIEPLISVTDDHIQSPTGREENQHKGASQHLIIPQCALHEHILFFFFTMFIHLYHSSLSLSMAFLEFLNQIF